MFLRLQDLGEKLSSLESSMSSIANTHNYDPTTFIRGKLLLDNFNTVSGINTNIPVEMTTTSQHVPISHEYKSIQATNLPNIQTTFIPETIYPTNIPDKLQRTSSTQAVNVALQTSEFVPMGYSPGHVQIYDDFDEGYLSDEETCPKHTHGNETIHLSHQNEGKNTNPITSSFDQSNIMVVEGAKHTNEPYESITSKIKTNIHDDIVINKK